jgi:hypothetical protein
MNNLNALVVDFVDIPLAKAIVEFNIKLFNWWNYRVNFF